jgi:uncharacterized OB-fold protein
MSASETWRQHKNLRKYLNQKGKLLVWTKILIPPLGYEDFVPYFSGIVKFEGGEKMPVQIVDCTEEQIKQNVKVIAVIRRGKKVGANDVIEYTVKVKPER